MEEKIKALKEQMEAALGSVESKEQLGEFWQNFLGKKGSIAVRIEEDGKERRHSL